MGQMIKVGMADLKICKAPDAVTTLGLGSCIGIAIRDPQTKIGGLAHIMLPDSTQIKSHTLNVPKFADTGAKELVNLVEKGTLRLMLGHLSEENNTVPLAMSTYVDLLTSNGMKYKSDYSLDVAPSVSTTKAIIF